MKTAAAPDLWSGSWCRSRPYWPTCTRALLVGSRSWGSWSPSCAWSAIGPPSGGMARSRVCARWPPCSIHTDGICTSTSCGIWAPSLPHVPGAQLGRLPAVWRARGSVLGGHLAQSIRMASAPAHRAVSGFLLDPRPRAGVSIAAHPFGEHDCLRPAAALGRGAGIPVVRPETMVRRHPGAGVGLRRTAVRSAHPLIWDSRGSAHRVGVRGLVVPVSRPAAGPFRHPHLLGLVSGLGQVSPRQPLDSRARRLGPFNHAPTGPPGRLPRVVLPGSGRRRKSRTAWAARCPAAHSDFGSVGRLPDLPVLPSSTRVLRWTERFLRPRDWRGVPVLTIVRPRMAADDGPLPVRCRAAAARLAAGRYPGAHPRVACGLSRFGFDSAGAPARDGVSDAP